MINIIDVGANFGDFGVNLAKLNPNASIHLIEPFPDLYELLCEKCRREGLSNVLVHDIALGPADTKTMLNVSRNGDYGTTSLLEFNNRNITNDPYWATRLDLTHDTQQEICSLRLQTFMENHHLEKVDFIKIDVQGLDLEVLASACNRISDIKAGMLEVPTTEASKLYIGEQQNLRIALNFLETNGFTVMAIKPNDPATNEVNVFFTRTPDSWQTDIAEMKLTGLPAFDGKHYWHAHSASPMYSDEKNQALLTENQRLRARIDVLDTENQRLSIRVDELDTEVRRLETHISLISKNRSN